MHDDDTTTAGPIYATWWGGSGYSLPDLTMPRHLEVFATIEDAEIETDNRYRCGDTFRCDFRYDPTDLDDVESTYCPGVDRDSETWIYLYDPRTTDDPYPDYIIRYDEDEDTFVAEPA